MTGFTWGQKHDRTNNIIKTASFELSSCSVVQPQPVRFIHCRRLAATREGEVECDDARATVQGCEESRRDDSDALKGLVSERDELIENP